MKITKFLTFAMALGVLFTSCNKDEVNDLVTPPAVEAGEGFLTVALADETGLLTKSDAPVYDAGSEEERKINQVEFYVFKADGQLNTYFTPASLANSYTFGITEGEDMTVVAAVNMNLGSVGTLSALRTKLYEVAVTTPTSIPTTPNAGIPMSGQYDDVTILTIENGGTGSATVVIPVARLFARFDAPTLSSTLSVEITGAEADSVKALLGSDVVVENVEFEYKGHVVINGLKKSYVLPNYGVEEQSRWLSSVWEIGNNPENYTASEYNAEGQLGRVYSGDAFFTNNEVVYLYENCPIYVNGDNGVSGYARGSVYSIIVEGDLVDGADSDNRVTRYWRINVSKTTDDNSIFKILRNSIYKVEINNVVTAGYGSPEEAEDEDGGDPIPGVDDASIKVSVNVLPWRVFSEPTDI